MTIIATTGNFSVDFCSALQGMLIKNAAILEKLHSVDTLVIDKTGTLTVGQPRLLSLTSVNSGDGGGTTLLLLAASLQSGSEHPLARAVLQALIDGQTEPEQLVRHIGRVKASRAELLEALGQTGAVLMSKSLNADVTGKTIFFTSIAEAKFRSPVRPGDTVTEKSSSQESTTTHIIICY